VLKKHSFKITFCIGVLNFIIGMLETLGKKEPATATIGQMLIGIGIMVVVLGTNYLFDHKS
jgi:Na+/phosphate symporter